MICVERWSSSFLLSRRARMTVIIHLRSFVWVVKRLTAVKEAFEGPFVMQGEWTWTVRGING